MSGSYAAQANQKVSSLKGTAVSFSPSNGPEIASPKKFQVESVWLSLMSTEIKYLSFTSLLKVKDELHKGQNVMLTGTPLIESLNFVPH